MWMLTHAAMRAGSKVAPRQHSLDRLAARDAYERLQPLRARHARARVATRSEQSAAGRVHAHDAEGLVVGLLGAGRRRAEATDACLALVGRLVALELPQLLAQHLRLVVVISPLPHLAPPIRVRCVHRRKGQLEALAPLGICLLYTSPSPRDS